MTDQARAIIAACAAAAVIGLYSPDQERGADGRFGGGGGFLAPDKGGEFGGRGSGKYGNQPRKSPEDIKKFRADAELRKVEQDPRFFDESRGGKSVRKQAAQLRETFAKAGITFPQRYGEDAPGYEDRPLKMRFVRASNGTADMGTIDAAAARAAGIAPGAIRLQHGTTQFGELHIDKKHGDDFRRLGFETARAYVEHLASHVTRIVQRPNDDGLAFERAEPGGGAMYIDVRSEHGGYYSVSTVHLGRCPGEELWKA